VLCERRRQVETLSAAAKAIKVLDLSDIPPVHVGLGSNTIEDAVYPTAVTDADGKPFVSDNRYMLHFNKDQVPPVRAFWSLTMYNERHLLAANPPIDRYAIGDRDKLATTRRPPPKCGPFRVQPRGSPLRQTGCWREMDSN
jgi:hypothetical protein